MNATAAQIPPDPTDVEPEDAAQADRPPGRKVAARRRAGRRTWVVGLLASALFHAVLFFAATRILLAPGADPRPAGPVRPLGEPRSEYMQVVQIQETPDAEAEPETPVEPEPDEPEPVEEDLPEDPVDERVVRTEPAPEPSVAERVPRSPAERLQPRMGDSRLWALPALEPPSPSDIERAREQIHAQLETMNDSMLTALAAEANAGNWTIEDGDGGRWGISKGDGYFPAELHLGDFSIPLPFTFRLPREARMRMQDWNAIRRQAARAQVNDWIQERIEAVRERRERERSQGDDGSGSG